MSMPGAEDTVGEGLGHNAKATTSASDRRAGKSRVSFEALVAVGDANGTGGFEAESVDVSQTGMRLRTAYLPDVGEKLLCRFEGDVGEIVAEGEVTWRREASRGGEFGLRFTKFESGDAEATLRAMCARINGTADPSAGPIAVPGTRVRLHIEGLGSPMKARVRDSLGGEIQVGSNLEFLKVGRPLELEDMDHGEKRPATVDAVKVEVDPLTHIPQLVVSLRFDGADAKKLDVKETAKDALNTLGAIARRATKAAEDRTESKDVDPKAARIASTLANAAATLRPRPSAARTSLPSVPPRGESDKAAERVSRDDVTVEAMEAREEGASSSDDGASSVSDKKDVGAAVRNAAAKASGSARAAMGVVGPAMGRFGSKAKGAVIGLLDTIRKRKEANADQEGQAFRRTTSAPPGGALRAAGRKLVRDRDEVDATGTVIKAASRKKAALIGGALGLVAVLAVVGGARLLGARTETAAEGQTPDANASAVAAALPAPGAAAPGAEGTAGTPVANVPLFGATPLSTTEPVPAMPTQPDGTVAPAPTAAADANAPEGAAANEAGSNDEEDSADDAKGDGKQFSHGNVRSPIVLKIKTDGDIETVNGAAGAMGFTISLPGRRAKSTASELMRKDKRIASLNIVNNPTGAEISVQFKDGVPAYIAKAKGNRLDIALGTDSKKVAKAGGSKSKKGSKKSTKKTTKKGAKKP